jgi:hypothetical protein
LACLVADSDLLAAAVVADDGAASVVEAVLVQLTLPSLPSNMNVLDNTSR